MRTTVNLDPDVERAVERLRRERGVGLSEAVNELMRAGLTVRVDTAPRFEQRTADLGAGLDVRNIGEVLEQLDGPAGR